MVTTGAVLHGDRERLLGFRPGGAAAGAAARRRRSRRTLAAAARVGRELGFDEINLNVGCPSDRVQSGCFGAALMRDARSSSPTASRR